MLGCTTLCAAAQNQTTPAYLQSFPNFAPALTSPFPGDVDTAMQKDFESHRRFAEEQRLFDLDAWQMFLAVNWPTTDQGQPAPSITDASLAPHWTLWQTEAQIYRTDGLRPTACGAPPNGKRLLEAVAQRPAPLLRSVPLMEKPTNADPRKVLLLANLSAVGNISVVDLKNGEFNQAFSGPLIDQNGNFVIYDISLDPHEVEYICNTGIYNINGQVTFSSENHNALDFPSGVDTTDWSGSTEVKFAWKIIDESKGDVPGRFFTMRAIIPTPEGSTKEVTVGLVGMHIGHKSQSSPQWIWATFEQVDNLVGDPLAHPTIKPSFYNPGCEICVPNLNPETVGDLTTPTQVMRAVPIPGDKIRLNEQAQAALKNIGSVWQYYELIDTQWPTQPSVKPAAWNSGLPNAIDNKPGGNPTPVFLTNVTMETYFQKGVQSACNMEELPGSVACPPGNATATNNPKQAADTTSVFASESCMGCHSSAGFYKTYDAKTKSGETWPQLAGDFSWLPQLKASYAEPPKP